MSKNTTETKGDRDDHARAGKVTVEEARVHLSRFNSSHFHRHAPGPHGRAVYSIPANPREEVSLGGRVTDAEHVATQGDITSPMDDAKKPLPPDLMLTVADAAALVGVSDRTIERYLAAGTLRAAYVGPRLVRIRAGDLAALVRPRPATPSVSPLSLVRLGAFITRAAHAFDAIARVIDVLKHDGCSCDCDHDSESHDEDCDRCLACRIEAAIGDAS